MKEPFGLEDHSDDEPVFSTDPVCGKKVDEAQAVGKIGYEGQIYYFCSEDCRRAFQQEPGKYAGRERFPVQG
jgi:YHS domain-containing protein